MGAPSVAPPEPVASRLRLELLGPPQVWRAQQPVRFRTRKTLALLAYLAATGSLQPRDHLAGLMWPEHDAVGARQLAPDARLPAPGLRAQAGHAPVVVLTGEAGLGKTRLAGEFLTWARAQGADVLGGRAFQAEGNLPYAALIAVLRPRLEQANAPEDLLSDL